MRLIVRWSLHCVAFCFFFKAIITTSAKSLVHFQFSATYTKKLTLETKIHAFSGLEPSTSATVRPQTCALDVTITGIDSNLVIT
jgi:hypothetical protein